VIGCGVATIIIRFLRQKLHFQKGLALLLIPILEQCHFLGAGGCVDLEEQLGIIVFSDTGSEAWNAAR